MDWGLCKDENDENYESGVALYRVALWSISKNLHRSTFDAIVFSYDNRCNICNLFFDPPFIFSPTPSCHLIPGTLHSLSPLATATVSPNESWYRPNPNTYQNTTVITINRTNISLKFDNGSIMVRNATRTSVEASTNDSQSFVVFNNTVPGFAKANVSFMVDGILYANATANASGFVSFNYTGVWTSHLFEWVTDDAGYDVNRDGVVDVLDITLVGQHFGETSAAPYPDYDVNEDGVVNMTDIWQVFSHMDVVQ